MFSLWPADLCHTTPDWRGFAIMSCHCLVSRLPELFRPTNIPGYFKYMIFLLSHYLCQYSGYHSTIYINIPAILPLFMSIFWLSSRYLRQYSGYHPTIYVNILAILPLFTSIFWLSSHYLCMSIFRLSSLYLCQYSNHNPTICVNKTFDLPALQSGQ